MKFSRTNVVIRTVEPETNYFLSRDFIKFKAAFNFNLIISPSLFRQFELPINKFEFSLLTRSRLTLHQQEILVQN